MKTLNWRHTDWSARKFIFFSGQEIIGELNFNSAWNFNGTYVDSGSEFQFRENADRIWKRRVFITRNGQLVGSLHYQLFRDPQLQLATGETFILPSNFFGRNVQWTNSKNEAIVKYEQASMTSMGKGTITLTTPLPAETEKVLIIAGLYIRQLILKKTSLLLIVLIPIFAS